MKKNIVQILLVLMLLLGNLYYNQVNAEEYSTFNEINEVDKSEFICSQIENVVVYKYPFIFKKIYKIFNTLDGRGYSSKSKFEKIEKITINYLEKINKDREYKKYIIILHIKCEAEKKLRNLTEENKKCFGNEKEWSDYNEYSSIGYHVYHNTVGHASYSSKCTSDGNFTTTRFLYCDKGYEKLPYLVKIDDDEKKTACGKIN